MALSGDTDHVLKSAMKGYKRILYKMQQGKTRGNRLGSCTLLKRRVNKICRGSTWFRMSQEQTETQEGVKSKNPVKERFEVKIGGNKPVESVMFIPCMEGGVLKKALQDAEYKLIGAGMVKYVKTTGRTIAEMLNRKDP